MTADEDRPRVRIDKQHPQVYRAQLEVAKAVRAATEDAGLDRTLVELVNIRVSQINGCAYCLPVHVRDALAGGETIQRLAVLPAWRDTTLFSACEDARRRSLAVLPFCPYLRKVVSEDPETYLDLVPARDRARFQLPAKAAEDPGGSRPPRLAP